jgi:DNA gyrase/topoisomerase IV subunit B
MCEKIYNYTDCYKWLWAAKHLDTFIPKDMIRSIAKLLVVYNSPNNESLVNIVRRMPQMYIGYEKQREYIFLQVLNNAMEAAKRLKKSSILEVKISNKTISVYNECLPISCVKQDVTIEYIPEYIFFIVAPVIVRKEIIVRKENPYNKNGFGAKIPSIFGDVTIDIINRTEGVQYIQSSELCVRPNLPIVTNITKPHIIPISKEGVSSIRVSYKINDEILPGDILKKVLFEYCADRAFCFNIPINLNYEGENITFNFNSILDFAKGKIEKLSISNTKFYSKTTNENNYIMYEDNFTRFLMIYTPNKGEVYSYVNGEHTAKGGVHVDKWVKDLLNKKTKTRTVLNNVTIFLSVWLDNPVFGSQSKSCLKFPYPKTNISEEMQKEFSSWNFDF